MSEFSFEGLFDEEEKSDYVVQCEHPVFASYAISTYTREQLYRFLQRHPNIFCHVENHATSGVCILNAQQKSHGCNVRTHIGNDPILNQADCEAEGPNKDGGPQGEWVKLTKVTCELNYGDWKGGTLAAFDLDKTHKSIFAARSMSRVQVPMFARYDILKKQYIEVVHADWATRYPQAMNLISLYTENTGFNGDADVINGLIYLNKEANRGAYRFLATDSPTVKQKKLNVQLLLNEIQSSVSGVVTYKQNLGFKLHPDCDTFESGVIFQLHLYDETIETRSNKRAVVQRGNPRFAMPPQTAFGVTYAGAIPSSSPGVLPKLKPGGEHSPSNMVAGQVNLSFNDNTKEFEAGNKNILARLLTDVAGVGLNLVSMETIDDTTEDQHYHPNGDQYTSNFARGWALPIKMHNNNPYEYGPVFKDKDCDKNKKHKIRVTNRSNRSFPTGQIVMCTLIDGEWIIMDFGPGDMAARTFHFGKWQFWKTMANQDSYRKDDRYHYDPNMATYHVGSMADHIYEGHYRAKFYQDISAHVDDMVSEDFMPTGTNRRTLGRRCIDRSNSAMGPGAKHSLGVMNGGYDYQVFLPANPTTGAPAKPAHWVRKEFNFIGSRRYQQTTSFDQLGPSHGGNADANMLGAINPFYGAKGEQIEDLKGPEYYHRKMYPHWGPVLRYGYNPEQVTALGTSDQGGNGRIQGYRAGGSSSDPGTVGHLLNATNMSLKDVKAGETYMSADWPNFGHNGFNAPDGYGIHLPADVATNAAPYSANGAPIEDLNELLRCVNIVSPDLGSWTSRAGMNGYVGGNAPDLMIGNRRSSGKKDLVAGTRSYLSDRLDDLFDSNTVSGRPRNSYYEASHASYYPAYLLRRKQKSWRLGKRPRQARWVYMAKDNGTSPTGDLPESLYNLEPVSANSLVFIPITAEHFGTFDKRAEICKGITDIYHCAGLDSSYAFNSSKGKRSEDIYTSANQWLVGQHAGNDVHVFPYAFISRNKYFHWSPMYAFGDFGENRIRYAGPGAHGDEVMSIYLNHRNSVPQNLTGGMMGGGGGNSNGDLYESVDEVLNGGNGIGIPYGIYARHDHKYGQNGQGYAPNDVWTGMGADGPAAIGISSAKCTLKIRGYELAIKSVMSAGIQRQVPRGHQRWGSSSDAQSDFGTTAGHVKLYDAWPEELTIFDPRYFAVMHFNPGQLLSIASGQFVGNAYQNVRTEMDTYDNMWRWVDNIETEVDYRIPMGSGYPGEIPRGGASWELMEGARVFAGKFYNSNTDLAGCLREKSEWMVSTTRRGMLLPFKWRKKTISLDYHHRGHNLRTYDPTAQTSEVFAGQGTPRTVKPSVWIAASGGGYTVGHTFMVLGGDSDVAGSMVITSVNTDIDEGPLGAIMELCPGDGVASVSNGSLGEGYDSLFFVSEGDYNRIANMNASDPVLVAPQLMGTPSQNPAGQANTGVGAVVYVLNGRCTLVEKLDVGPLKQQATVRFTAKSNGRAGARKLAPYARKLQIRRPNKEYAYDIFMQHHNDASHVFMHGSLPNDKMAQFTQVDIIGV